METLYRTYIQTFYLYGIRDPFLKYFVPNSISYFSPGVNLSKRPDSLSWQKLCELKSQELWRNDVLFTVMSGRCVYIVSVTQISQDTLCCLATKQLQFPNWRGDIAAWSLACSCLYFLIWSCRVPLLRAITLQVALSKHDLRGCDRQNDKMHIRSV